jgi:hypothetical protein
MSLFTIGRQSYIRQSRASMAESDRAANNSGFLELCKLATEIQLIFELHNKAILSIFETFRTAESPTINASWCIYLYISVSA